MVQVRHGKAWQGMGEEVAVVLDVPTKLENTVCGTVRAMLHIKYHWDSVAWLAGWRAGPTRLEPQEINVLSYMLVCDGPLCGRYLDTP